MQISKKNLIMIIWIIVPVMLLIAGLIMYIYNRDNEKIKEIYFSGMILGLTGVIIGVLLTLKSEKISSTNACSFVYSIPSPQYRIQDLDIAQKLNNGDYDKLIPNRPNVSFALHEYFKAFPERFNKREDDLYLEVLCYSILDRLFQKFHSSWEVKDRSYELANGSVIISSSDEKKNKSVIVSWSEVISNFPNFTIFMVDELNRDKNPIFTTLHLPPKSRLEITVEKNVLIMIDNPHVSLSLNVRHIGSGVGFGRIGSLMRIPLSENNDFTTSNYEIEVDAVVKKMLSGSPETEHYKCWINTIMSILEKEYNFSTYWEELKEWQNLSNRDYYGK